MDRQFGEKIPVIDASRNEIFNENKEELLKWISDDEIGNNAIINTPFGKRKVYYCDYAASARSLASIEKYISHEVLPLYGNTHSSVTTTSEQTTLFLHEARDVIRNATYASEHDAVLFVGNGTTAAIELLRHLLDLQTAPIIITGIHEHHSNLLPWREIASEIHIVGESKNGQIDIVELENFLKKIHETKDKNVLVIGCFTAVSNITGIIINIEEVTECLKRYGCLSFWDYASGAPYIEIVMNGKARKDAIYFSGHKFIGGVQTPGVLVVKKKIIANDRPRRAGGGTVFFVSQSSHSYLKDVEYREEGGTTDVVGAVRLALAFKLKNAVGYDVISDREREISRYVINRLSINDRIILLGVPSWANRLPIFSFLIKDASSLFLHHNYVSALLNDLFGIQSRSGCVCAGPYAQFLLGINESLALSYRQCLMEDARLDRVHLRRKGEYSSNEVLRPGFTRISLPYNATYETVDFVVSAIEFIAENGAAFMNQYQLNCESGEWHHYRQRVFHSRKWLGFANFTSNGIKITKSDNTYNGSTQQHVPINLFAEAHRLAKEAEMTKIEIPDGQNAFDDLAKNLRWFVMASELKKSNERQPCIVPFSPRKYPSIDYVISASESECSGFNYHLINSLLSADGNGIRKNEIVSVDKSINEVNFININENESFETAETLCNSFIRNQNISDDNGEFNLSRIDFLDDWNRRIVVRPRENIAINNQSLWVQPPFELYRKATKAIHDLDMIEDGDRVLVCLSGGKDSLSLLHILHQYQIRTRLRQKKNFKLGAITIDPQSSAYNPRPLISYCESLNIEFFYEMQDIIGHAARLPTCRSICAFCSRMKRGRLAAAAKLHGYNVLAMGHHLDDLVESFLIAAFHNGNLSTMKATYITRDDLKIIRPLIYIREKQLRDFAEYNCLPVIAENCPACFEQPKERYRLKQLLASYELIFPQLFASLRSALHPLIKINLPSTSDMRKLAVENIKNESKMTIQNNYFD